MRQVSDAVYIILLLNIHRRRVGVREPVEANEGVLLLSE